VGQASSLSSSGRHWLALSGVLFAAFFIAGDVLGSGLTSATLPLPGAPAAEVARYYADSQTAELVRGVFHILSAASLFVFAGCVFSFVRRTRRDVGALPGVTIAGGFLAAAFLLASGLLTLALVPVATGGNLALVDTLRTWDFLSGGTLHVAALGLFIGAASLAAREARSLPGWVVWLGIVAAALSILSLASLVLFPATILIPLGRLFDGVWSIGVGIVLALGRQRAPAAGDAHRVLT
jgi:hypothetical protein